MWIDFEWILEPFWPSLTQDWPKMAEEWPKICPRLAQDGPRSAQDGSKDEKDDDNDDGDDDDEDEAENRTRAIAIFLRTSLARAPKTGRNDGYQDSGSNAEGLYPTIRGGLPCNLPPLKRLLRLDMDAYDHISMNV